MVLGEAKGEHRMSEIKTHIVHSSPVWLAQTKTWMYNQIKYLPERIETHVVCDRVENLTQFYLPNIHSLYDKSRVLYILEKGVRKVLFPRYKGYLSSRIKLTSSRLLHSHFGPNGWLELSTAKKTGVKQVVTFYGYDVNMLPLQDDKWFARYQELFDKVDLILCEGPHMAKQIIKLGCVEERIKVHHLGVETHSIKISPKTLESESATKSINCSQLQRKEGDSICA